MTIEYIRGSGSLYTVIEKHTNDISFAGDSVTFTDADTGETVKISSDDVVCIYDD